jgi:tetratricopeptide (TPR) repeat protein
VSPTLKGAIMVFGRLFSGNREKRYEEGQKLFELGMVYATQYKTSKAIEYYTKSIDACKNPAPYINRANLLSKRIRYYEALQDLLEARRLDVAQGNEFSQVLKREIALTEAISDNYNSGMREKLIADYNENGGDYVGERILCVSFGVSNLQWEYNSFNTPLIEYHFFNELDNIIKFEDLDLYPEVEDFVDGPESYPKDFIEYKVNNCPDEKAYKSAEMTLHSFLCSYDEEEMRYIRRNMIYEIHRKLMARDFGDFFDALDSDCRGITKEAEDFIRRTQGNDA